MNSILNMRIIAIAVVVLLWPAVVHASKDRDQTGSSQGLFAARTFIGMVRVAAGMPRRMSRTVIKK
jgi:hypothetical protein